MFNFPLSPPQASNFAGFYDAVFYALVALTVLFTAIVGAFVLAFAVKYRVGNKVNRARPVFENLKLELTWTIIPLILGLIMFFFGAKLFVDMRTPPKDAIEIFVIGKQWMWHAQHPNGVKENNTLHVPVGKPVKLTMISQDVIHAMYIPAFRVQYHVVPGRYTQLWFTATKPGVYYMFCNMYCGTQHSEMGGYVYAMDPKDYAEWLSNGGEMGQALTMEQQGAKLWNKLGCNNGNCHGSVDSERGPSLNGIFGKNQRMADGSTMKVDEAYLREAILQPYNHIVAGYDNTMPAYEGQITEEDVLHLIAYIKTLGTGVAPTAPPQPGLEPTKGSVGNVPYNKQTTPTMAVGAIEAQQPQRPGPRPGNNSVGAMSVPPAGNRP